MNNHNEEGVRVRNPEKLNEAPKGEKVQLFDLLRSNLK
jgi:hypothetical protein